MQKHIQLNITLYNEPATDLGQLGLCFQIMETVYASACNQLGISEHSPQIVSLDVQDTHVEVAVKGLKTPLQLTKGVMEHPSRLLYTMKTEFVTNRDSQKSELSKLFENVSIGIDKVKNTELQEVIKNSIGYFLARRQSNM